MVCDVKVLKPTLFVALIPASTFLKTRFVLPGSSRHHTNYDWLILSKMSESTRLLEGHCCYRCYSEVNKYPSNIGQVYQYSCCVFFVKHF